MDEADGKSHGGTVRRAVTTVIVSAILVGGAYWANEVINSTEPAAERDGATRRSAALVETVVVAKGSFRPQVRVLGVVEPAQDISLSPRVDGQIAWVAEDFTPGGIVSEGSALLKLDPVDYEMMLTMRKSERKQVEAELALENGRQDVALREFELLGESPDSNNRSLVLREPQIQSVRAQLQAAEAAERTASLALERTTVLAPFNAQVITRDANVGSQVGQGSTLARLVGIKEYWVRASVPVRSLRWIDVPEGELPGSTVNVGHSAAWGPEITREGVVARLVGVVDTQTRMAQILVSVPDPLALQEEGPELLLGSIVELEIGGRELGNVVRLDRSLLRQGNTVWVMTAGAVLDIRDVNVVFSDAEYAYIDDGLEDGDEVVTTTLAAVVNGLELQKADGAGRARPSDDDGGQGWGDDDDDEGGRQRGGDDEDGGGERGE